MNTYVNAKDVQADLYRSFMHNRQTLGGTKLSLDRWMGQSVAVHTDKEILISSEKKTATKP